MSIIDIDEVKELKRINSMRINSMRINSMSSEDIVLYKKIFSFDNILDSINDESFSTFYHLIESFYDELKDNLDKLI